MSFWNPLTCITGCLVVYSVGEFLSKKTKGAVSSLLFACVLFLIGFWSGLLPKDITTQSGLVAVMANFGTAFMITNIGTLINLEDLGMENRGYFTVCHCGDCTDLFHSGFPAVRKRVCVDCSASSGRFHGCRHHSYKCGGSCQPP